MAANPLSLPTWRSFAKGKGYKDGPLLRALEEWDKQDVGDFKALQKALEGVVVQLTALLKAHKDDKALQAYFKSVEQAVAQAAEAGKRAAERKSKEGDEPPVPPLLGAKLLARLREARRGEPMEVLIATTSRVSAVMLSRRKIAPANRKLLRLYLQAKGGLKFITGQCLLEDGKLMFAVTPLVGGLERRLKAALLKQVGLRVKLGVREG